MTQNRNLTPSIYITEKKFYVQNNFDTNVYNSIFYSHHRLETTQMCFKGWMDKQTTKHIYNEILLSNKIEWTIYA